MMYSVSTANGPWNPDAPLFATIEQALAAALNDGDDGQVRIIFERASGTPVCLVWANKAWWS